MKSADNKNIIQNNSNDGDSRVRDYFKSMSEMEEASPLIAVNIAEIVETARMKPVAISPGSIIEKIELAIMYLSMMFSLLMCSTVVLVALNPYARYMQAVYLQLASPFLLAVLFVTALLYGISSFIYRVGEMIIMPAIQEI